MECGFCSCHACPLDRLEHRFRLHRMVSRYSRSNTNEPGEASYHMVERSVLLRVSVQMFFHDYS
jgi:hypothetical protein